MEEKKYQIIAEVKTKSPFGFQSPYSWEELFQLADKIGDIISIHTDSQWGGSFENRMRFAVEVVRRVRAAVGAKFVLVFRIAAMDMLEDGMAWE